MEAGERALSRERLEALRRVVEASPGDARARYFLAVELSRSGDARGAVDQLVAYLDLDPVDPGSAYKLLGICLERLGETAGAADAYRTGIVAATAHGHASLASEIEDLLDDLES